MKIRVIQSCISLGLSALLGYLFFTLAGDDNPIQTTLFISGAISIFICLECALGISWGNRHHSVNIFATSFVFAFILIAEHICFALWGEKIEWPIIATGGLVLVYILIITGIRKTN